MGGNAHKLPKKKGYSNKQKPYKVKHGEVTSTVNTGLSRSEYKEYCKKKK